MKKKKVRITILQQCILAITFNMHILGNIKIDSLTEQAASAMISTPLGVSQDEYPVS